MITPPFHKQQQTKISKTLMPTSHPNYKSSSSSGIGISLLNNPDRSLLAPSDVVGASLMNGDPVGALNADHEAPIEGDGASNKGDGADSDPNVNPEEVGSRGAPNTDVVPNTVLMGAAPLID